MLAQEILDALRMFACQERAGVDDESRLGSAVAVVEPDLRNCA
jgi:hypothetical protein